jgi:nitroreductase
VRPNAISAPQSEADRYWETFCAINARRRAIRDFDDLPVSDDEVCEVLEQALLAPSSGNLQPYQLHWIRDSATKAAIAAACEGQRAAASAPVLLVVAASVAIAAQTAALQVEYVERTSLLDERSKGYHRRQLTTFGRFLRWGTLMLWTPIHAVISAVVPAFSLLPFGSTASRHWAARSAVYTAQTILLAAAARGLDSCPMEGFNAAKVARILELPRGTVIPIVIALGRRRGDARAEPRWRRSFDVAVTRH